MSNKDDKTETVHSQSDNNIIEFPQPSTLGGAGSEENVGDESPPLFYFEPEWDTGGDDSAA